jgi:hypothetical protein
MHVASDISSVDSLPKRTLYDISPFDAGLLYTHRRAVSFDTKTILGFRIQYTCL